MVSAVCRDSPHHELKAAGFVRLSTCKGGKIVRLIEGEERDWRGISILVWTATGPARTRLATMGNRPTIDEAAEQGQAPK
jgi:hypothetical protein